MMTLQEAYQKAKIYAASSGKTYLWAVRDYGDFWGFLYTVPDPDHDLPVPGAGYTTVNKKTGIIGHFAPVMDLAKKSVPIPIDQFTEYSVAV